MFQRMRRARKYTRVACLTAAVALLQPLLFAEGARAETPIDVGTRKQLFIDDRFIDSSRGVSLTMNPPRRDGRVLLEADQPWEENGAVQVYSSVLLDRGKVRLWYDISQPTGDGPHDYTRRVAYAESDDGIHFDKPILNLHEVNGSRANNIVLPGVIGGAGVWIDPRAPAKERYKNVAKVYPSQELHLHSSPDGLHWNLFAKIDPGPGGWDTQNVIFLDPAISRYVLYTRYWAHRGKPNKSRTVRRLESDDLRTWDRQTIVMQADELDLATHETGTQQPPVDYYGACVYRYDEAESVYIMLAQAFWHWRERSPLKGLGPDSFDVRLAVSHDGKSFQRAGGRKPFMAMGPAGRFDAAHVWALPNPIRMGDELWIYYAGANMDHSSNIDPAANGKHLTGIGVAVLRLDGFVSADADYTGGEITTPLLRFNGRSLELNAETSGGGAVRVEFLDEARKPIAGYSRTDALAINGNSVRLPVRWQGGADVSKLAETPIRIRFHLNDCKLYAFQFRD